MMRVLFIGDVVGKPGRAAVTMLVPKLREEYRADAVIANGENCAGGLGATFKTLKELTEAGVDAISLGNHTWRKRELVGTIDSLPNVVRPANFPTGNPGRGYLVVDTPAGPLGLLNLQGRIFMDPLDCPFAAAERDVKKLTGRTSTIVVDFHAEATSEKIAMGWFLDGSVSAVIGTHTHVQTADERILPGGSAYITDAGMTGPEDSVLGIERESVLKLMRSRMPQRFIVAKTRGWLAGVMFEVDTESGRATRIERINRLAADDSE